MYVLFFCAGLQTVGIFRVGSSKKRVRQVSIFHSHLIWSAPLPPIYFQKSILKGNSICHFYHPMFSSNIKKKPFLFSLKPISVKYCQHLSTNVNSNKQSLYSKSLWRKKHDDAQTTPSLVPNPPPVRFLAKSPFHLKTLIDQRLSMLHHHSTHCLH